MFDHSRNTTITGGIFMTSNTIGQRNLAFEKLQKASAPTALHNSSARLDPPTCHPNTRVAILEYLMGWVYGHNEIDTVVLWLYGPAGGGKSSILQTLADRCDERNALLASFFFCRTDSSRNTFKPLIATLASQIVMKFPEVRQYIEGAIERDLFLFDRSVDTQVQSLIVAPLKALAASGYFHHLKTWARLILIDALDECDDLRMQSMILRALANALRDQQVPLILLIASRPEQHIFSTFNSPSLIGVWKSVVLDESFKPNDDIRLFLTDSFRNIKATHPYRAHIPDVWPGQSNIDELMHKSSGQFMYASIVIKYVSVHDDLPPRRLEVVRGLRPARRELPFAELDAFYLHILDSCKDQEAILSILGYIISDFAHFTKHIELLLDLEPGEVEIALTPLYSIVTIRKPGEIRLSHASFNDFLTDSSRSGQFYIDIPAVIDNGYSICVSKVMQPPSIAPLTMSHEDCIMILTTVGYLLVHVSKSLVTEASGDILKGFSLPQFWTFWCNEDCEDLLRITCDFLTACLDGGDRRRALYEFHRVSLEPLFSSKLTEYYNDAGLKSLVVVATFMCDDSGDVLLQLLSADNNVIFNLLRLTQRSIAFNRRNLQLARPTHLRQWFDHYPYRYSSSPQSSGLDISRRDITQTAIRILEFLCAHPPHPTQRQKHHRKHSTPKPPSDRRKMLTWAPHFRSTISRKEQLTNTRYPRKRREEKHRCGVTLLSPDISNECRNADDWTKSCLFGLALLPRLLKEASESAELKDFISVQAKKIVFMPKYTKDAICAMHRYLDLQPSSIPMLIDQ